MRRRVTSLALLLALLISCNFVLKPVRSSLFLNRLGAESLPYVYLLVGVILSIVATVFARATARRNLIHLFLGCVVFFASNLVVFWWLAPRGWRALPYVFYLWVSVFIVAMPSLFWLLANYVLYPNEAKRVYGTITAGGLLGSIFGGGLTSLLVRTTGTRGLLLVAAALVGVAGALASYIWRSERDRIAERLSEMRRGEQRKLAGRTEGLLAVLGRSSYLTSVAAVTGITSVASTLVDYQFNDVAGRAFSGLDELTRFFGTFFAALNAVAFVAQVLFAGRLVSRFGVGVLLLFLPVAFASTSLGMLAHRGLWTAALLMASDVCFNNSFNRIGLEILYLPVPLEVKNRVKTWIDMVVDRAGRGVGGIAILALTVGLGWSGLSLSVLLVVLVIPWVFIALKLARDYVGAFRDSIARRDIDVGALTAQIQDSAGVAVLRQALSSSDERQLLYALELISGAADPSLESALNPLLAHPSPAVRLGALRTLGSLPRLADQAPVQSLARDLDARVRAEALAVLMKHGAPEGDALLSIVESEEVTAVEAALDAIESTRELVPRFTPVLDEAFLNRLSSSPLEAQRTLAARVVGFVPEAPFARGLLKDFLRDPSLSVAKAAASSAAKLRPQALTPLLPHLLEALGRPPLRAGARQALAKGGERAEDLLVRRLQDASQPTPLRAAVARTLAEFESQRALDELLVSLPQDDPHLHHRIIKALGKMRARFPSLRFNRARVDVLLSIESLAAYEVAGDRAALGERETPASFKLLARALREQQEVRIERLFRLLGLLYPPTDIFNSWYAVVHGRTTVRAAALEFLENLLGKDHRQKILPLVEAENPQEAFAAGRLVFDLPELDFTDALRHLAVGKDAWLAACAITVAGELRISPLEDVIAAAAARPERAAREAAQAVGGGRAGAVPTIRARTETFPLAGD